MSKPLPPEGPTRESIKAFLRERHCPRSSWDDPEYQRLEKLIEARRKELLDDPTLKRLQRTQQKVHAKICQDSARFSKALTRVRRLYQTHGLTPMVVREFQKLAVALNVADNGTGGEG